MLPPPLLNLPRMLLFPFGLLRVYAWLSAVGFRTPLIAVFEPEFKALSLPPEKEVAFMPP
jgi:hypothetical protein